MSRYAVYVETRPDGTCLAHVPELPGCNLRAPSIEAALLRLPEAIRDYCAWLRRHGELAPTADEPVELDVIQAADAGGPFAPGDTAALLPPDREPVSDGILAEYLRLMAYNRADLLALVSGLPEALLDWRPTPDAFSLRRLLRHVGNSEEWYASRLVPPDRLPTEWERDEEMALWDFLAMERETAAALLSQLDETTRREVFYPTVWTDHPDEPWTAGKVLRRFLEHEREHTGQAREILSAYRQHLLARLAGERAGLLDQVMRLDETAPAVAEICPGWKVPDLLAHIAGWDRWQARAMQALAAGEEPDLEGVRDIDQANARFVAAWRGRPLGEVLAELASARSEWVTWLESLPLEGFFQARLLSGEDWSFYAAPIRVEWEHDAEHTAQIAAWRAAREAGANSQRGVSGLAKDRPAAFDARPVLRAALGAGRDELLAAAGLVPADERETRPVCGHWTLRDVLGHMVDWERVAVEGLERMAAGQAPQMQPIGDLDDWNEAWVVGRAHQPYAEVLQDLHATRQDLLGALAGLDPVGLGHCYPFPWGGEGTPYDWVGIFFGHDREHAAGLRSALAPVGWPTGDST